MRITKEHDVRRNEILDTAETLFYTKGYMKTTINDILHEIGIAKGTFYYYFKSKEEVMYAIIKRIVDHDLIIAKEIAADPTLDVHSKLLKVMLSQGPKSNPNKQQLTEQFELPGNEIMHQQTLTTIIKSLSPVLAEVVQQGVQEGIFHLDHIQETIEFLIAGGEFIFDVGTFNWTEEEQTNRVFAFLTLMEHALCAEKGSFTYLKTIFQNQKK